MDAGDVARVLAPTFIIAKYKLQILKYKVNIKDEEGGFRKTYPTGLDRQKTIGYEEVNAYLARNPMVCYTARN